MPTDNTGMQTRAMAQRTDSEPQETQNQNTNPTVELYKSKDESIKDFIRKHGTIALDWYVPNFSNTRVGDLIVQRLPIETADGRLVLRERIAFWRVQQIHQVTPYTESINTGNLSNNGLLLVNLNAG